MALEGSTITNESNSSEKPICLVWGCKLDSENPTYTFEMPEAWSSEEQLTLRTICLGESAKDEFNSVEIVPPTDSKDSAPVRIAILKPSVLPMVTLAGFELTPPVTFRLKSGLGPVYLAGQHVTVDLQWSGSEEEEASSQDEDDDDEDDGEEEMEESPVKPAKRLTTKPAATAKKQEQQPVQEQPLSEDDICSVLMLSQELTATQNLCWTPVCAQSILPITPKAVGPDWAGVEKRMSCSQLRFDTDRLSQHLQACRSPVARHTHPPSFSFVLVGVELLMRFLLPYLIERKHRMKNVVLLGFTAILGSSLVGSFRCHQCSIHEPGRKCIPNQFPCMAKEGEVCFVEQLFLERTILSIEAGCRLDCTQTSNGSFLRLVTRCCSTDLCNVP
ncbi:hypothetical protein lerEdw1_014731 [Lerista edwardsae]|nr:hypothetical protein lerEdw1_014734 [Lerista edwardsae]KAJ6628039.1 hypothetical protein lerEdw1_014731 [Lerista edwardsae]